MKLQVGDMRHLNATVELNTFQRFLFLTANVDPQTDGLIQKTIRQKFEDCTVLTIAHRLNTVIDSDRILVMDAGRCVEFGTPYELLSKINEPRIFYNMLKETGKETFESLRKTVEKVGSHVF